MSVYAKTVNLLRPQASNNAISIRFTTENRGTRIDDASITVYSWITIVSQTVLTPVNSAFQTHRQDKTFLCQTSCNRRIWWEDGHTAPRYLCSDLGSRRLHTLWERSMIFLGTGRGSWVDSRVINKISALELVSRRYEGELLKVNCSENNAEGKRCPLTELGPKSVLPLNLRHETV